jgi:hypothetical protein
MSEERGNEDFSMTAEPFGTAGVMGQAWGI